MSIFSGYCMSPNGKDGVAMEQLAITAPCCSSSDEDDTEDSKVQRLLKIVLDIEFLPSTSLEDVGLQIWPVSLLMCDLIVHLFEEKSSVFSLELGSGLGVVSMTYASMGGRCIATDYHPMVLRQLDRNCRRNAAQIRKRNGQMRVRGIDWKSRGNFVDKMAFEAQFAWTDVEQMECYENLTHIFVSEGIYDSDASEHLFATIEAVCSKAAKRPKIFVAMERRPNFCLETLSVEDTNYDDFCRWTKRLTGELAWQAYRMDPLSIPQVITKYSRTDFMELWQLVPDYTNGA